MCDSCQGGFKLSCQTSGVDSVVGMLQGAVGWQEFKGSVKWEQLIN